MDNINATRSRRLVALIETVIYTLNEDDTQWLVPQAHTLLAPEEQERWQRFRVPEPGNVFLAGRFLLRNQLAKRLKCVPEQIRFAIGEYGKPHIETPMSSWKFNLSHSRNCVLLALADGIELGVDIEQCKARVGLVDLAERVLTPAELRHFGSLEASAQEDFFFRAWVLKESYVKLMGTGIWQGLTTLDVDVDTPCYPDEASSICARFLSAPDGFAAALAYHVQDRGEFDVAQHQLHCLRDLPEIGF